MPHRMCVYGTLPAKNVCLLRGMAGGVDHGCAYNRRFDRLSCSNATGTIFDPWTGREACYSASWEILLRQQSRMEGQITTQSLLQMLLAGLEELILPKLIEEYGAKCVIVEARVLLGSDITRGERVLINYAQTPQHTPCTHIPHNVTVDTCTEAYVYT